MLAPFKLYRVTHQGCPLSPLLFALAIEPLAIAIPYNINIQGLRYKTCNEHIALYANDILLFLADPGPSLQNALSFIQKFGTYSGLKTDWDKSSILPIDHIPQVLRPVNVPLIWSNQIKYLGISQEFNFVDDNLYPLLTKFTLTTASWKSLRLTLEKDV